MLEAGVLESWLGPMFSGKSTRLLQKAMELDRLGLEYVLLKPSFDNRYAESEVVSHDGVRLPCLSISGFPDIADEKLFVLIDEVQFFGMEIIPWVKGLLAKGKLVFVAGLDMDWQGDPFIVSGALAAMSDRTMKCTSRCMVCTRQASKTLKIGGSQGAIELGASDKYEPRCNFHWQYSDQPDTGPQ